VDAVGAPDLEQLPNGLPKGALVPEVVVEDARRARVHQQVRIALLQVAARERPVVQRRPCVQPGRVGVSPRSGQGQAWGQVRVAVRVREGVRGSDV